MTNDGKINKGRWTNEERIEFERLLLKFGKEWKKISDIMKTRTVVQVRTHAQKYFKKLAKSTGKPVLSTSKKQGLYVSDKLLAEERRKAKNESRPRLDAPRQQFSPNQNIHSTNVFDDPIHRLNTDFPSQKNHSESDKRVPITLLGLSSSDSINPFGSEDMNGRRRSRRLSRKWSTVTPRTMAAATILAAPKIRKNSEDDYIENKLSWAVATLEKKRSVDKIKPTQDRGRRRRRKIST